MEFGRQLESDGFLGPAETTGASAAFDVRRRDSSLRRRRLILENLLLPGGKLVRLQATLLRTPAVVVKGLLP